MNNSKNKGHSESSQQKCTLQLFVTGATPNSTRAVANIKSICETHLQGKYELEIIDVYRDKELAIKNQIVALPMLIRRFPLPERRLIGDMSKIDKVLGALELSVDYGEGSTK